MELFGSEAKATRWLAAPLDELGDHTPEQVLRKDPNADAVFAVLDRIDYGLEAFKIDRRLLLADLR